MYNCILVHSTQAKSYHELRTGQTNNNDLTRYSASVTNGGGIFHGDEIQTLVTLIWGARITVLSSAEKAN